jgi:hypothetical protein
MPCRVASRLGLGRGARPELELGLTVDAELDGIGKNSILPGRC